MVDDIIFNKILKFIEEGDTIRKAIKRLNIKKLNPNTFYKSLSKEQKAELDITRISNKKYSNYTNAGYAQKYKDMIYGFDE